MSRLSRYGSSCSKQMYSTFAWPPEAMLRAIWRAIVVLPVPWAPPIRSSSPARRPPPMVLSSGVNPSGTGWYSETAPPATFSLRSTSTSRAERGASCRCGVEAPGRRRVRCAASCRRLRCSRGAVPPGWCGGAQGSIRTRRITHPNPQIRTGRRRRARPASDAVSRGRARRSRPGRRSGCRSRSCARSIHSFGAWALSSGWMKPEQDDRQARGSIRSWRRPGCCHPRGCRPGRARTSPRAPGRRPGSPGWSIGVRLGRPPPRYVTVVVTPGGAIASTYVAEALEDPLAGPGRRPAGS